MPNDYSKRLKDPRWQRKRLEVMERDKWTCVDTLESDDPLQVHHCWYAKGGPWETPNKYLITVTEDAHNERHKIESDIKKTLGLILANLSASDEVGLTDLGHAFFTISEFLENRGSIESLRPAVEELRDCCIMANEKRKIREGVSCAK